MNRLTKLLSVFVIASTVSVGAFGLAGCHKHTFDEENWKTSETQHWHAATCEHADEKKDLGNHVDANDDGKCDVCDYQMDEEPPAHEHTYSDEFTAKDETGHWRLPTCDDTTDGIDFAAHVDENGDGKCDVCGYEMEKPHEHTYSDEFTAKDETGHWRLPTCDDTTDGIDFAAHVDENGDGKCDVCGYEEGVTQISTVEDFLAFRLNQNLSGTYKLTNDIDLSGIAIEDDAKAVIGAGVVFDGNGYTIKNATYAAGTSKVGLLCKTISDGTVQNVKFLNCSVTSGSESAGILAGTCEGTSTISKIEFNSCSVSTTGNYAGLLFARNEKTANITISEITTKNGCIASCSQYGGLLVGDIVGTTTISFKDLDVAGELAGSKGNGALIAGRTRAGATVSVENAVIDCTVNNPTNNAIISGNGACTSLTVKNVLIVSSNSALIAKSAPAASSYENIVAVAGVTVTGATGVGTDSAEYLRDTLGFDFENVWTIDEGDYRLKSASTNSKSEDATITTIDANAGNATVRFKQGEAFSSAGLVVMGTYSDGVMLVLAEGVDYEVISTDFKSDTAGTYTITVKSLEDDSKTDTYTVTVVSETGFKVYDEFMTHVYRVGDKLDKENLVVKAVWSDGVEEELAADQYDIAGDYNLNAVGNYTVLISYGSYEAVAVEIDVLGSIPVPVDGKVYVNVDASFDQAEGTEVAGVETFSNLTDAIDFLEGCKLESGVTKVIYVAEGTYNEKVTTSLDNLTLIGEGVGKSILTYSAVESTVNVVDGSVYGLDCATLHVNGTGFKAYNMEIRNDFDYINDASKESSPQGLALTINGDQAVIANSYLYGNQDTLYLKSGRAYFYNTQIDGNIDFIFGNSNGLAFFDNCTIKAINKSTKQENNNGYVTAMKADATNKPDYGYIFYECELTDDGTLKDGSMSLGRPWGASATVAYINCNFSAAYSTLAYDGSAKSRWYDMSGNLPQNADFVEYGSTGAGAITEAVTGGSILTEEQAANYNKSNIFAAVNGKCTWSAAWDCDAALTALLALSTKADAVTDIYVSSDSVSVEEGKTAELWISVTPWNAPDKALEITVADPTVATYSDGVVSGLKQGSTTITVKYGETLTKTVNITVTEAMPEDLTIYETVKYTFGNSDYEELTAGSSKLIGLMLISAGENGSFVKHNDGSKYYKLTGDATIALEVTAGSILNFVTYDNELALTLNGKDVTANGAYDKASGDCTYTYTVAEDGTLVLSIAKDKKQLYLTSLQVIVPITEDYTYTYTQGDKAEGTAEQSTSLVEFSNCVVNNSWLRFNGDAAYIKFYTLEGAVITVNTYDDTPLMINGESVTPVNKVATYTVTETGAVTIQRTAGQNLYISGFSVNFEETEWTYTYTYGGDNASVWDASNVGSATSDDAVAVTGAQVDAAGKAIVLTLDKACTKATVSMTGFTKATGNDYALVKIDLLDDAGNVVGTINGKVTKSKLNGEFVLDNGGVIESTTAFTKIRFSSNTVEGKSNYCITSATVKVEI